MTQTKKFLEEQRKIDIIVAQTLSNVEKEFGKGSAMKLGADYKENIESISTNSPTLDIALGVGGIPKGRVTEIFGPESSGKTTLSLHCVANAQETDPRRAAYIDVEHALDPNYSKILGVDIENLIISQPTTGEEALEIMDMFIKSSAFSIVVLDSVASLVPEEELTGSMSKMQIGLQARLMSKALRKLTGSISKTRTAAVFTNQIRQKVQTFGFGNPNTTSGGLALRFYSSCRIELRRTSSIKVGETIIGNTIKAKVVKNKVAPPFKEAMLDIIFNEGISKTSDILNKAIAKKIIVKSGAWFSYGEENIGQGKENARLFLKNNKEILKTIEKQLLEENPKKKTKEVSNESDSKEVKKETKKEENDEFEEFEDSSNEK